MSTPSIADSQRLVILEKHAEQWALTILRGTTFTDCLKLNGITPARDVITSEGKTITIRGSDIYDSRTWRKFLARVNQGEPAYQLTDVGEDLARQYKAWLLSEHTERYRALSTEAELAWFERVVALAVVRHIMEDKYAAYTIGRIEVFAEPWIAAEMGKLLMLNLMAKEAARMIHHIVKEPAQARQILEQFYEEHYRQIQAHPLLMREPLPTLPPGVTPPFASLTQKVEERYE